MGARLDSFGRFVCGRSVIWVEERMSPLCKVMGMGWFILVLLTHGVSVVMECSVVPESATAKTENPTVVKGKTLFGLVANFL